MPAAITSESWESSVGDPSIAQKRGEFRQASTEGHLYFPITRSWECGVHTRELDPHK